MKFLQTRDPKGVLCLILIFIGAVTFIFRTAAAVMLQSWSQEEYSHGYLIPPLALILLLNKMADTKIKPRASWAGLVIVTFGIVSQFAFQFAGVKGLLPQIYLASLIGIFALFWGTHALRPVAGPLGLLFFCAPLPKLMFYTLSFDMQMMSSSLGTAILTGLGIPVFQDGNIIDLGGYQLQVAEACSGIRYLFPLMGLSFLLAYMYKTAFWKRVLVFVSAAPISILMNGLRIAIIGVTVDCWGRAMAEGMLHEFEGWIVFAGCMVALLLEVMLLQKIGPKGELSFNDLKLPSLKEIPLSALGKPVTICAIILALGVMASIALPYILGDYLKPVLLQRPLTEFPLQLDAWRGHTETLDTRSLDVLGTTDYFIADYEKVGAAPVNLYVLYYPQQDSMSNQAVHSPAVCIPGGGWEIVSQAREEILLAGRPPLAVNRMLISKGMTREIVYYWFIQDGFETADPSVSRLAMLRNALLNGRTNGALIRIMTIIDRDKSDEVAEQRLAEFLNDSMDTLARFVFGTKR